MTRFQRALAALAGVILVAAAAHVTILATGGYNQPAALIPAAIALGVVAGGALVPVAARNGRIALAVMMTIALVCGESAALIATAERVIVARDQNQVPLRQAAERHASAVQALNAALGETPAPASRVALDSAQARLDAAEAEVRKSAASPGCRQHCAKLLQEAVDAATRDLDQARATIAVHETRERERIAARIEAAKASLTAAPMPASASPLADRLHLEPWVIDVISALLVSLGVNGLGITFIAFAAHGRHQIQARSTEAASPDVSETHESPAPVAAVRYQPPELRVVETPTGGAADLVLSAIERSPGDQMELGEVYEAYVDACRSHGLSALPPETVAGPLRELCRDANIQWRRGPRGTVHLVGVKRKPADAMIEAPAVRV